jgi:hypothetical protein
MRRRRKDKNDCEKKSNYYFFDIMNAQLDKEIAKSPVVARINRFARVKVG